MCDTFVATKTATASGATLFAKNSDRPPNEAQYLVQVPRELHPSNQRVRCSYIEIPQVRETHALLLSKPFWMWGAEMGVNDRGLVIGNEAVFSKIPANKEPALLGMDLLRLALERADNARTAMQTIIDLLEQYGQGGNCVHEGESYYHNSFLIADANDAWVLETVGRQWAARQIKETYSISNCITIQDQYDLASAGLVETALKKGFTKSPQKFNFAMDYSDFVFTVFGKGRVRRATTSRILEEDKSALTARSMMNLLRHHKDDPQHGFASVDICMHAGGGPIRISQSTASMVVHLENDSLTVFATGTSAPCTGIFKPMWIDASLPDLGAAPVSTYDSTSLFWSHERLHRATMLNYKERINAYKAERDALEEKFTQTALAMKNAPAKERAEFCAACFREAALAEADWLARIEKIPARKSTIHSRAWGAFNRAAAIPSKP